MIFTGEELFDYLSKEVSELPCFKCSTGMLELLAVQSSEQVKLSVVCSKCKEKDKMYISLKFD